jgi:sterol desaturase/sphingolipid hydroxylase (fatty acid hydroxylase superfamily)
MNYVELAVPFFILAVALEFLYGKLAGRQTYRLSDTVNSLQLGVLSRLVDLLRLSFSAAVVGSLVALIGVPQWSMDAPWQWLVAFVAYDFCYYWKHRYGHQWRIMWASHAAHHQSEEFNLSTALRQTGTDYIGFVFYIPLFLAGLPASAIITVGSLNLIYQFWVHTEHIRRLGPLEWLLVTPSNHRVHHARNPCYIDRNYAGVFILWDRLFGTFEDERPEEPCVYGVTKGLRSWNPLWANFHVWSEGVQNAWRAPRWRDKLLLWFKPPAWVPPGMAAASPAHAGASVSANAGANTGGTSWQYEKFDPPASSFARAYTFVQFWLLTGAALWLLKAQATLPRLSVLALLGWLCYSMFVQGVWLEGRPKAMLLEWLRLTAAVLLAVALREFMPTALLPSLLLVYSALSAALLCAAQLWPHALRSLHPAPG